MVFSRRIAAALACACLGTGALGATAAPPAGPGWHDPLDTPAAASTLAQRGLLTALARAGERLVAVGQRGHVLWSDDGGHRWQQATVPVSSDLVAVAFPTPTQGWAVGHDGVMLASTDGGRSWTRRLDGKGLGALLVAHYEQALARAAEADRERAQRWLAEARRVAEQGAQNPWLDVWFQDAGTGFVVGAFGLVLHTRDGGQTWTPWLDRVDNPKALHLYAVRGIGADVFMVGEQGLALKLDRAAGRFRALDMPYAGTLFGITGTPEALVVHGLRGSLLRSTDGGRLWQALPATVPAGLGAAATDAQGRIVVVSQAGHVLLSSDRGASFAPMKVERPLPAAAVLATPAGLVLAGPRGVHILNLP
jgi:photosystem II stability/assembly factor-like uncharacterized protein